MFLCYQKSINHCRPSLNTAKQLSAAFSRLKVSLLNQYLTFKETQTRVSCSYQGKVLDLPFWYLSEKKHFEMSLVASQSRFFDFSVIIPNKTLHERVQISFRFRRDVDKTMEPKKKIKKIKKKQKKTSPRLVFDLFFSVILGRSFLQCFK